MGYDQFHALLTAILVAGSYAAQSEEHDVDLRCVADTAKQILDVCGFVRLASSKAVR